MRQAAAAGFISIGGLYRYFSTKRSLVMFGLDPETLEEDCAEFFPRYGRLKLSDPPAAVEAFIRFVARQVFFVRPTVVATLELGSEDPMTRIEAMLNMGDKVIEELVLALPDARDRDWCAVARSMRRLTLAAYLDRSMNRRELENELRTALTGAPAARTSVLAAS
jgi:AcrR family transcriptional regulator